MTTTSRRCAKSLRKTCIVAAALLGTSVPGSVVARTVEYLNDLATIKAAADDQGIPGPFSEVPSTAGPAISLSSAAAADHRVIVASNYCQAYHIENPISVLLQDLVTDVNRTGPQSDTSGEKPTVTLRLLSGSTVLRCMGKSDLATMCKNRVKISAEASVPHADGSVAAVPLVAQVEREGRVGGFCGNIARYTGIVTREAVIDLLRQARAL